MHARFAPAPRTGTSRFVVLYLAAILMAAFGTANLQAQVVCDSPNVPPLIPHDDPGGLVREIVVDHPGLISDLDVYIYTVHPEVSLLTVRLEHVNSATAVTLVSRPGWNEGEGTTCQKWGLDVILDDDGTGGPVNDQCANSATAFYPTSPPSYTPYEPLSAFNGVPAAGTWRLTVTDVGPETVGGLQGWCLLFETVPLGEFEHASSPSTVIPDNNPFGISDLILVPQAVEIERLAVHLDIKHTWVGDLIVELEHVATGRTIRLLNRPRSPSSPTFGCSEDDIYLLLDDDGTGGEANNLCILQGGVRPYLKSPPFYVPAEPLSEFQGLSSKGHWRLRVSDNAAGDTGRLVRWSIHFNGEPPYEIPPAARAIGDFNSDSCVDFTDFIYLLNSWGVVVDGTPIGFGDFIALLNNWGRAC